MVHHISRFFKEVEQIARDLDHGIISAMVDELCHLRERKGRLFLLGVGGSAANCSHAVNDFRKLCGIEAYTPVDNVSELTARTNDEGFETVFASYLKVSNLTAKDALFVFSVGGGDVVNNVSPNIVHGLKRAKEMGVKILGIVGRDGGYTKKVGDHVLVVPTVNEDYITPHAEAFQAVIWHCLVSHPKLCIQTAKWESLALSV